MKRFYVVFYSKNKKVCHVTIFAKMKNRNKKQATLCSCEIAAFEIKLTYE
jgi:hypothetical protein